MPDSKPPTPKKFLTNQGENTLSKRLEKILPLTQDFDCLVGYFFISGFFRLYPALESVKKVRILIGLKNEQVVHGLMQIAQDRTNDSIPSTAEVKGTFGGMLKKELVQADDSLAIETGIRKFIEWIRSGKLEVKLYRDQNIHAKVYIMTPEHPVADVNHGYVITGSSNLSHSGLEGNLEFNVLLGEPEEHDYALHRFNELWEHAVDVKDVHETILDTVEKDSPFAFFTPHELYLKFLAEYFRDYIGDRSRLNAENLPSNFKKLAYQEDAVFTAQQMLKTYGGVFIADVVGLGKTYISALLALQLDGRCLVIAPPSLLDENSPGSWPRVFRDFCIPGHKCVSIGKLEEILEQGVEGYKYVFIDESHRFKGDSTQRYELLTRICQNKGVILVSATPYNNSLKDVFSQLKLFQPARNSAIPGLRNLEVFFEGLEKRLKGLHRLNDAEQYAAVVEQNANELRERVLKYIMVRRTRKEILEFYGKDLKQQKITFPKVTDPVPLLYQLNATESDVFQNTLIRITAGAFNYARYKPLDPLYYTRPVEEAAVQGQRNLAGFMKILLVKRLESSFFAFQETLKRFIQSHELVLKALDDGSVYTSKKHSRKVLDFLEAENDEALDRLVEADKAERFPTDDFHPIFREHIESDLETLRRIKDDWATVKRDPKWIEFKSELTTRPEFTGGKLIIFTEFADTASYLADQIRKEVEPNTLLFSSASSKELRSEVISNFDPNVKEQKDDYRILVTTDVLAEGVNLHRSAIVINYDIPWNPSRLMQRVGRVNRRKGLGAYYTPREIVHYMCQESLINYLDTTLNPESTDVPRADIETFIREGDQAAHYETARKGGTVSYARKLSRSIETHARALDEALNSITVCDPAIGSGAFPVGMMTEIVKARTALTPYFNDVAERTPYHFKRHAIQNSIYGVDIDAGAVEIAKLRLWLSLVVDEEDITQIKPLPNLDYKVVVGNSLIGVDMDELSNWKGIRRLEELKPQYFNETNHAKKLKLRNEINDLIQAITNDNSVFDFEVYFSEIFQKGEGFSVVIANPPYLGEKGHKETFREIAAAPLGREFYVGKMDLFYFFFHLALNLSRKNGSIAFITTNYYITATGAKKLRDDFKSRSTIKQLINFNEAKIFETALGQHNMISILGKGADQNDVAKTCITSRKGFLSSEILKSIFDGKDSETTYFEVPQKSLYDASENYIRPSGASHMESNSLGQILTKMRTKGRPLEAILKISTGIQTGVDKISQKHLEKYVVSAKCGEGVFVLSKNEVEQIGIPEQEKSILKPWFKNSDVNRWVASGANESYVILADKSKNNLHGKKVIQEHLKRFSEIISDCSSNAPYLHRPRKINFDGPKIVVPQRSRINTFAYNSTPWYASVDVYFITDKSNNEANLKANLAILNSKLYYLWFYHEGKRKGESLELYQKPLSETPMPSLNPEEKKSLVGLVDKIIASKHRSPKADTSSFEKEIDLIVYRLFGLTASEIALVESSAKS